MIITAMNDKPIKEILRRRKRIRIEKPIKVRMSQSKRSSGDQIATAKTKPKRKIKKARFIVRKAICCSVFPKKYCFVREIAKLTPTKKVKKGAASSQKYLTHNKEEDFVLVERNFGQNEPAPLE
jgi:ribosomal protein S17